jgi:hypothetical protein
MSLPCGKNRFCGSSSTELNVPQSNNDDSGLGWSDSSGERLETKFFRTSEGLRRKRVGRGGRILFDRVPSPQQCHRELDFEEVELSARANFDNWSMNTGGFEDMQDIARTSTVLTFEVFMEPAEK